MDSLSQSIERINNPMSKTDIRSLNLKELKDFIARFSANASKSRQATSRKKSLEKINNPKVHPRIRELLIQAITTSPIDFTVIEEYPEPLPPL